MTNLNKRQELLHAKLSKGPRNGHIAEVRFINPDGTNSAPQTYWFNVPVHLGALGEGYHVVARTARGLVVGEVVTLRSLRPNNPGITPTEWLVARVDHEITFYTRAEGQINEQLKSEAAIKRQISRTKGSICDGEAKLRKLIPERDNVMAALGAKYAANGNLTDEPVLRAKAIQMQQRVNRAKDHIARFEAEVKDLEATLV